MTSYLPQPWVLQWLADRQLVNRLVRSVRLWKLICIIHGDERNQTEPMPQQFNYSEVRSRLYAPEHPQSDLIEAKNIQKSCLSPECICHQTLGTIIFQEQDINEKTWKEEIKELTGFEDQQLNSYLQEYPFATVHRSIRDDLRQLVKQGWLKKVTTGTYQISQTLPKSPMKDPLSPDVLFLSKEFGWSLLRILETFAFAQPSLAHVTYELWEQLIQQQEKSDRTDPEKEPPQRTFIHLDYILSKHQQDLVDNYQEQLEELWQNPEGGMIQFTYFLALKETKPKIITYPVCLHYMRRAKYLTGYGIDPHGKINWHNYRLDRIASSRLKILAWEDQQIPKDLKQLRDTGKLPTPSQVQEEINKAWGFNFYLPKELLIIRFPTEFAKWYVDDTERHPTFKAIAYQDIINLLKTEKISQPEIETIVAILAKRSPKDVYYRAWVRKGDINVLMRLRDWRPKGEVIAPLSYREILTKEATDELLHYT